MKRSGRSGRTARGVPGLAGAVAALWALGPAAAGAGAQDVTVVRAARMLDVRAGRMVENAVVVVEGETIRSVNPSSVPGDARTLDLGDRTLLPGLMDLHTHLYGELDEDFFLDPVTMTDADLALRAARGSGGRPGGPLDDVTVLERVEFVMKGGRVVKGPDGPEGR